MKTKMANVIFAQGVMEELKTLANFDLPIRESVKAIKLIKELTKHFQIFDEARVKLLNKYGTLNQKDSKYEFETDDKKQEFNREFADLQRIGFEVEHEIIEISGDSKIKPAFLMMFEKFVKVKETPEVPQIQPQS